MHESISADGNDLPVLPDYIRRDHDDRLACVISEACGGASGIAVLDGGSSTGKTRALGEALQLLRADGRMTRAADAGTDAGSIGLSRYRRKVAPRQGSAVSGYRYQ